MQEGVYLNKDGKWRRRDGMHKPREGAGSSQPMAEIVDLGHE
jgi:hypothetical protein